MERRDVAVIGGGLLGCFAARELSRYDLTAALLEQREDVCTGISKANTAIVYPGYDTKPGSLKAQLTIRANRDFPALCAELDVPFSRCGSLMVSYGRRGDDVLREKLENGRAGGVPGLRLLSGGEARALEPGLREGVTSALYAESTATADPWQLCYAAYENALHNGCRAYLSTELTGIRRDGRAYVLETDRGELRAAAVVNCAGLYADKVQELLFPPSVRIFPDGADYLVLERGAARLGHIIFHEPEDGGKGLTAVPTTGGSILLGPSRRRLGDSLWATRDEGLAFVAASARAVLPQLDTGAVIRSFSAVRPNPHRVVRRDGEYVPDGGSIGSFVIEHPEPGFLSFIGVKTPGMTCARELGLLAARQIADHLGAKMRQDFDPRRRGIPGVRGLPFPARAALVRENPAYGQVLCLCEDISEAEVLEAIARGAVTLDGVKRRCGATLGVCQGARCDQAIAALLAQKLGVPTEDVTRSGAGSYLTGGRHGTL
jgi:glycerol-3-phosphate dehydrogenase